MTETTPDTPTTTGQRDWSLPALRAPLAPAEAIDRLDKAARRGTLPGFERAGDGRTFSVDVFGEPFDRTLVGACEPDGDGAVVRFTPRLNMKAPLVLIVSVVVSVWPGVVLVDGLIPASWGWWDTWTWYLPLVIVPTVLMLPWMWRKSERAAREHARKQVETIRARLDASEA